MSLDVTLFRSKDKSETMEPSDLLPFDQDAVWSRLQERYPQLSGEDPQWLVGEFDHFEASFGLDDPRQISVCIHLLDDEEPDVSAFIRELCDTLDCQGFDFMEAKYY